MERLFQKELESFSEARNKRRIDIIDDALDHARNLLENRSRQGDPFAMHVAVESLPVEVLVEILRKKTVTEFYKTSEPINEPRPTDE